MKLTKINYGSAMFFGAIALVMYVILGVLQIIAEKASPGTFTALGVPMPTFWTSIVVAPIVSGVVTYLVMLLVFVIYNYIAKKYPISWEIRK